MKKTMAERVSTNHTRSISFLRARLDLNPSEPVRYIGTRILNQRSIDHHAIPQSLFVRSDPTAQIKTCKGVRNVLI
jgi:hypothetical protein